ncbi:MAG: aminotransferase class [Ilumatobacteraceae bacterium]|nr:aminotransferase class [Ilumatobacteraceae bacterium]
MPIDVDLARSLTPGTQHVAHLNNAGAGLTPQPVIDVVAGYLRREADIGGYEVEVEHADALDRVYDSAATLIGARREEIALVESATAAWNAAFAAVPFEPGDRIVTGRSEYASNAINFLLARERHGVEIVLVDDDDDGQISLDGLRNSIDDRTKLIAMTHVATSGGLVNPAAEVGRIAADAGVLFLLDACQSVGQRVIDVDALRCDILSTTGRKWLRGPRGTGFLYVRASSLDRLRPAMLDLRSAEWTAADRFEIAPSARRFEEWEGNRALQLGLGAAIDHAVSWGIENIAERTTGLAVQLRRMLAALPRVAVHDKGGDMCGIVTFTVDGVAANDVKAILGSQGVNTSVTGATSAQYDFPRRGLTEVVRASPQYYNTEAELHRLVDIVGSVS